MDNIFALKLKSLFHKLNLEKKIERVSKPILSREEANEAIISLLSSDVPCMIARYGANELAATVNYMGVKAGKCSYWGYARGTSLPWWWYDSVRYHLSNNAGFFPATDEMLCKFGQLMLDDSKYVDLLGTSQEDESYMMDYLSKNVSFIRLSNFEPFWYGKPWTSTLKNKRVLVVYPLADTIKRQYERRELLFEDKNMLPEFKSLHVIESVQSLGGKSNFSSWFDALHVMESQIDKIEYDVALIGCGAYGFPLAAHVKRQGKKAIHMGGSVQLLFGITGGRWDKPIVEDGFTLDFSKLVNKYWVRPSINERPDNFQKVEDGCYW